MLGSQGVEPSTAFYGAILLLIWLYLVEAWRTLVSLSLWQKATACLSPGPVAGAMYHLKPGTVVTQQRELTRYFSLYSPPSCFSLQRRRWLEKKSSKGSNERERNIYRFCVILVWFRLWLLSLQTNPLSLNSKTERVHLQAVTRWKHP